LAAPEAVSFAGFGFARGGGLSARRGVTVLLRVSGSGRDGVNTAGTGATAGAAAGAAKCIGG